MTNPHRANWRNPSEYPPVFGPKKFGEYSRLAWEYLRRNKQYAKDVETMLALPEDVYENGFTGYGHLTLDVTVCSPPANTGETVKQYKKRMKESGIKGKIATPKKSFINRWSLETPVEVSKEYSLSEVPFRKDTVGYKRCQGMAPESFGSFIYPDEVLVRFNMNLPLELQLSLAKRKLNEQALKLDALQNRVVTGDGQKKFQPLRTARVKHVLRDSHYWLRCYDALSPLERNVTEKEVLAFFVTESKNKKKLARPSDGFNAADQYIHSRKYLLLITNSEMPEITLDEVTNIWTKHPA